jgi:hypothetical protein
MASALVSSTRAKRTGSASISPREPSALGRPSIRKVSDRKHVHKFFEQKKAAFFRKKIRYYYAS